MKVLFITGEKITYTRNSSLLKAISSFAEVINISSDKNNYLKRHLDIFWKLILLRKKYDLVFVGFYGQLLVFLVKIFTRKPIIFDAFISTYQTLCFDRKKFKPNSIIGRLAFFVDKYSCTLANKVILDTNVHIDYFVRTFELPKEKFHRVFVGAEEDLFYPREQQKVNTRPLIFTYSSYQPLHGTEYVLRAAKLLEDTADFLIIGKGQERPRIDKLMEELKITNVKLMDKVPYEKLPDYIAEADICLGGHFSDNEKANMVIAGKTFQFVAMKKLTITADNLANSELFDKSDFKVTPADPEKLALKIKELIQNSKKDFIAEEQNRTFLEKASSTRIKEELATIFNIIK